MGDSLGGPPVEPVRIACGRVRQQVRRPPVQLPETRSAASPGRISLTSHPGRGKHRQFRAASSGQFDDLGSTVTVEGSRRSKIIDGAQLVLGRGNYSGLPYHQIELVALRVGERGLADRRYARGKRRRPRA